MTTYGSSCGGGGQANATNTINLLDPAIFRTYEGFPATFGAGSQARYIPTNKPQIFSMKPDVLVASNTLDPGYGAYVTQSIKVIRGLSDIAGHRYCAVHEPLSQVNAGDFTKAQWIQMQINIKADVMPGVNAGRTNPIRFTAIADSAQTNAQLDTWFTSSCIAALDELGFDVYGFAGGHDYFAQFGAYANSKGKPWGIGEIGYSSTAHGTDAQELATMKQIVADVAAMSVANRPNWIAWFNSGNNTLAGLPQSAAYWKNLSSGSTSTDATAAAQTATGTGQAWGPTIVTPGIVNVRPAVADGTGAAMDATVTGLVNQLSITVPGHTEVVPGVAIRVRAVWQGVSYPLWRGFVDSWGISYTQPNDSQIEVKATDATRLLASYIREPLATPVGVSEDTGARVNRILDSVSWSPSDRIIATGDSTLQATDLGGNAWDELLTSVASEAGDVYPDTSGRMVFRNRRQVIEEPQFKTAQAVFGDHLNQIFNLCPNPNMATGISGWNPGGSVPPTLQWTTEQAFSGTTSMKMLWGTGGTFPLAQTSIAGLTIGQTYTWSFYGYCPTGSPDFLAAVGTLGIGSSSSTKDAWARVSMTFVATSTTHRCQVWPLTAPTAGQLLYVDAAQLETGGSASTFDDSNLPAEMAMYDFELTYDADALFNIVGASIEGGTRQEARDSASVDAYFSRPVEATGLLLQADSDAANYAGYILHLSRDPELRVSSIVVKPRRDPDRLWPVVLSLSYGDRVTTNLSPPGGGARISRDGFVRGITHDITPAGEWDTGYTLQSASNFQFWTLGDPLLGRIGENSLSF